MPMIYPEDYDLVVTIKKEPHYRWPHSYVNGNSARCEDCRYYLADRKPKVAFARTGECRSKAHQTERGYTHRRTGWDYTSAGSSCKWWFPIGTQPDEQEELPEPEAEE